MNRKKKQYLVRFTIDGHSAEVEITARGIAETSAAHYEAVAKATESIGRYCQALDQAKALRAEIAAIRQEMVEAVSHPGQAIRLYQEALS